MREFLGFSLLAGIVAIGFGFLQLFGIMPQISRQPAIVIVPQLNLAAMCVGLGLVTATISAAAFAIIGALESALKLPASTVERASPAN